jgi:glyoxylase-like metal-dependent hydrolase (beta-lactamase superfamily II)
VRIGIYRLHAIESGSLLADGGAMFGVVPKIIWNRTNKSDEKNRIRLALRNLLLISDDKKILIDTGAGNKYNQKFKEILGIANDDQCVISELEKINLTVSDITDVILTHLHFDHAGGSTIIKDGSVVPAFPNANYYIQKSQLEWALNPSERDKSAYSLENFLPLIESKKMITIDGNCELFPGIELIKVNGHTPGQQLVRIFDSEKELYFCADLIPLSTQLHLPYIMGYDLLPLITLEEKRDFIQKAYENKWILFFEHDEAVECAYVGKNEKGTFIPLNHFKLIDA